MSRKYASLIPMIINIYTICRLLYDPACTSAVLMRLRREIGSAGAKVDVPVTRGTIRALVDICDEIVRKGHGDALLQPFVLVKDPEEWEQVCYYILDCVDDRWWHLFVPLPDCTSLCRFLENQVRGDRFSERSVATIRLTHRTVPHCDWTALAAALQECLDNQQDRAGEELDILRQGLVLLRDPGCPGSA